MLNPVAQYTNAPVNPLYFSNADTDNVALAAGVTYPAGQVLGLVPGTGTAVNDVQTVTITGTPTGGTFTITYGNVTTAAIAYNATAAQVAAAVNLALGGTFVTGGGGTLPGTPVTLTFANEAAGMNQPLMTATGALTGGSTPAVAITHTTPGKPAGGYFKNYDDTASDGSQTARRILKYACTTNLTGNVTYGQLDMTSFGGVANRAVPAYYKGYFRISDLVGIDANGVTDLGKLINANAYTDPNAVLCVTGA